MSFQPFRTAGLGLAFRIGIAPSSGRAAQQGAGCGQFVRSSHFIASARRTRICGLECKSYPDILSSSPFFETDPIRLIENGLLQNGALASRMQ